MTREWYKNNGYNVSQAVDAATIDRAEEDCFAAYVRPILPDVARDDDAIQRPLADLAYLRLLQRTLKATRGGTKEKTNANSMNADLWAPGIEQATTAAAAVDQLRAMDGAVQGAEVKDICGIYFKTQFFYL